MNKCKELRFEEKQVAKHEPAKTGQRGWKKKSRKPD